ncbi:hypothetical protein D3C83_158180 [compost metagenome]
MRFNPELPACLVDAGQAIGRGVPVGFPVLYARPNTVEHIANTGERAIERCSWALCE